MKNFVQAGQTATITASRDVKSGELYAEGALMGFAQSDAAEGEDVVLVLDGVYQVSVTSVTAVETGEVVYLDGQTLTTDPDAGINPRAGIVILGGAPEDGVAVCHVKINA